MRRSNEGIKNDKKVKHADQALGSFLILLFCFWSSALFAAPFPIEDSLFNTTRPKIAYDSANDRHLVIWETGQEINASLFDGRGTPLRVNFPVLWKRHSGSPSYDQASVTFKPDENQYYVVARETVPWFIPGYAIVVQILNANGDLIRKKWIYDTGVPRLFSIPEAPIITAKSLGPGCCLLVAWEDQVTRGINGILITADGNIHSTGRPNPVFTIAEPISSGKIVNPSAIYDPISDRFFIVYEMNPDSGYTYIAGRTLPAAGGDLSDEIFISNRRTIDRRDDHPSGFPRAVMNTHNRTVLVTWYDQDSVQGALLGPDFAPITSFRISNGPSCSGSPIPVCQWPPVAVDSPSPLFVEGGNYFRVYFNERTMSFNERTTSERENRLVSYRLEVSSSGRVISSRNIIADFDTGSKRNADAAYSPLLNNVLVVWQKSYDIWGQVVSP